MERDVEIERDSPLDVKYDSTIVNIDHSTQLIESSKVDIAFNIFNKNFICHLCNNHKG